MRELIVKKASDLIDTPFHHQGRNLAGLDCAGLIVYVLKEVGLYQDGCDILGYSRLPNGNEIAKLMSKYFDLISIEEAKSGDILLFRFEQNPQHLAWLEKTEDSSYMIHAYGVVGINKVVKNRLDEKWSNKLVSVYRIKDIEEYEKYAEDINGKVQ